MSRRRGPAVAALLSWPALLLAAAAVGGALFWPEGSGGLILFSAALPLVLSGAALLVARGSRASGILPAAAFGFSLVAAIPVALVGGLHLLSSAESRRPEEHAEADALMQRISDRLSGADPAPGRGGGRGPVDRRAYFQEQMRRAVAEYTALAPEKRGEYLDSLNGDSPRRSVRLAREMLLVETDPRLKVRLLGILDTHLSTTFVSRYPEGPANREEAEAITTEVLTLLWNQGPGFGPGGSPGPGPGPRSAPGEGRGRR